MLANHIKDVDVLLALAPEDLANTLLYIISSNWANRSFQPESLLLQTHGAGMAATQSPVYPAQRMAEAELAVEEALQWMRINILIVPAPGTNGRSGWMMLSRRGAALAADKSSFQYFREAAAFPKALLHPRIADKVWLSLARGDLDEAVLSAFKGVEIAVREAAQLTDADFGVALMRAAFNKNGGPLTNMDHVEPEREALSNLFAGAIGSYKNPHSHRTVNLNDPREAQEMVLLASHLLRIVDSRKPTP